MKAMINTSHVEGYLYDHKLDIKVTGENAKTPNVEFINGSIDIATDDECTNIITVYFTYVTALTKRNAPNQTYNVLKNILDGKYFTVMNAGQDKATKLRVDCNIGLNEFYSDRTGKEELVSVKRNEGRFVHVTTSLDAVETNRNTFSCDMLITGVTRVEANPERGTNEKVIVRGSIFDFRNALLPCEFSAVNPAAMSYFENLNASFANPTFTKIWGQQISEVVTRTQIDESAFGEDSVREVKSSRKDFIITGASREPYLWDDESTLTVKEVQEAAANRELYLASIKQRQEEYRKSSGKTSTPAPVTPVPAQSDFKF